MNLPVEVEEVRAIFSIAKSTVDVIRNLCGLSSQFEPDDDEAGEHGDMKDCIKEAILILTKETQAKKSSHLEKFVENTLFAPECGLEPSSIFYSLKDIEQMTWRQFCLLEGYRRQDRNEIEIMGYNNSGPNGVYIWAEIEQLIGLKYLDKGSDSAIDYTSRDYASRVHVSLMGQNISKLLNLQSVELEEIGKAFGGGMVKDTTTKIY